MASHPPRPTDAHSDQYAMRSISDVERDTGLPRATIRMWERRYGFPSPLRDARGERCYPDDQVARLVLMRRLIEQGHRPAGLVAAGPDGLRRLHDEAAQAVQSGRTRGAQQLLRLLRQHDVAGMRALLADKLAAAGLAGFACDELPAMNRAIGDAWQAGELEVHEEHLYSDCVYEVGRAAIAELAPRVRAEAPTAVLTTFPDEPHALGLLGAQAMLSLQGCTTISLGVRLPPAQIAAAVRAYRADLVGLSFTPSLNQAHILRGLEELRGMLPVQVRIWAGGSAPALMRRSVAGVRGVTDVRAIPALLAEDFALPPLA